VSKIKTTTTEKSIYHNVEFYLRSNIEKFEKTKAEFIEKFEKNPNHALKWYGSEMAVVQGRYDIASQLITAIDNDDEDTTVESVIEWFKEDTERTIGFIVRGGHGSSSFMSNIVEDCEKQAKMELYEAIKTAEKYNGAI
jgi:hypothetical protein